MNNKDETYLTAHSNLQSALVNFVVASYAVNLDEEAIAVESSFKIDNQSP